VERRRLLVSGLVQGVGYRYSMARTARALGITGWVRNRVDGSVEAVVAGPADAVAAILYWARQGPPGAQVEHVAVELAEGSFETFEQRPTE